MTGARVACRINDNFCSLLESGPKPTVAAVESMALGGGLETALACNARICTPGAPLHPERSGAGPPQCCAVPKQIAGRGSMSWRFPAEAQWLSAHSQRSRRCI